MCKSVLLLEATHTHVIDFDASENVWSNNRPSREKRKTQRTPSARDFQQDLLDRQGQTKLQR
jgi:hypothetical protein